MPDIHITVRDRIAQADGDPEIVCGNSDYTAVFDFDAEWVAYSQKTLRTVWRDTATGKLGRDDVLFDGNSAVLPPVWRTNQVLIGVYAGDIRTTTAARVPCIGCITDTAPHHDDPDDALYRQLIAYLEQIEQGGGKPENAVMIAEYVPFISFPEVEEGTMETDMMCAFWEQGGGNTATGEFNTQHTTRIRDPEHIRLPLSNGGSRSIRFDAESGNTKLDYIPYFYADGAYIVPEVLAWHTYDENVAIPANATTTRFVVRFPDDRVIVPLNLTSCTAYITT